MEQVGWLSSDFLASREAHLDPILSDFNLNKKPVNLSQHMARVAGDNVYCCTALGSIDKYAFFLKKKKLLLLNYGHDKESRRFLYSKLIHLANWPIHRGDSRKLGRE